MFSSLHPLENRIFLPRMTASNLDWTQINKSIIMILRLQIAIFAYLKLRCIWILREAIDGRVERIGRIKKRKEEREELVGRICTNFVVFHVAEGTDAAMARKERQGVPSLSSQTQASVVLKGWCVAMGTMPSYHERTWGYLFFESSVWEYVH